jgi:hypothetical protein
MNRANSSSIPAHSSGPSTRAAAQTTARPALVLTLALACGTLAPVALGDVVADWNRIALQSVSETASAPPPTTRTLAMMHTAMYNAINGATPGSVNSQYAGAPLATSTVHKELAAAKAARDVLAQVYPSRVAEYDARVNALASTVTDPAIRTASLAFGQAQASHIIAQRTGDGANTPYTYTPSGLPGRYAFTGASQTTARFNNFATTTPWAIDSASQFRPVAPAALNSVSYAQQYNQVKELGSTTSTTRTAEQTTIARFWAAGSGTVTPPGMWNQVAQTLAVSQNTSVEESARMFALLNITLADAAIACWDAKAFYDSWRPITAIRAGDTDGNDATIGQTDWTPLLTSPEFQAYTSGHSTFSGAAATILAQFFGTDQLGFDLTDQSTGVTRTFDSLWAAAQEAGMSRIFGGIHFMEDNTEGLFCGQQIAMLIAGRSVVPAPGAAAALALGGLLAARRRRVS